MTRLSGLVLTLLLAAVAVNGQSIHRGHASSRKVLVGKSNPGVSRHVVPSLIRRDRNRKPVGFLTKGPISQVKTVSSSPGSFISGQSGEVFVQSHTSANKGRSFSSRRSFVTSNKNNFRQSKFHSGGKSKGHKSVSFVQDDQPLVATPVVIPSNSGEILSQSVAFSVSMSTGDDHNVQVASNVPQGGIISSSGEQGFIAPTRGPISKGNTRSLGFSTSNPIGVNSGELPFRPSGRVSFRRNKGHSSIGQKQHHQVPSVSVGAGVVSANSGEFRFRPSGSVSVNKNKGHSSVGLQRHQGSSIGNAGVIGTNSGERFIGVSGGSIAKPIGHGRVVTKGPSHVRSNPTIKKRVIPFNGHRGRSFSAHRPVKTIAINHGKVIGRRPVSVRHGAKRVGVSSGFRQSKFHG